MITKLEKAIALYPIPKGSGYFEIKVVKNGFALIFLKVHLNLLHWQSIYVASKNASIVGVLSIKTEW